MDLLFPSRLAGLSREVNVDKRIACVADLVNHLVRSLASDQRQSKVIRIPL